MRKIVLIALAGVVLAGCGGSGGRSDAAVANDLKALLDRNGTSYISVGPCVHQSGDQYVCGLFTADLSSDSALVTDDGSSIDAKPIPK